MCLIIKDASPEIIIMPMTPNPSISPSIGESIDISTELFRCKLRSGIRGATTKPITKIKTHATLPAKTLENSSKNKVIIINEFILKILIILNFDAILPYMILLKKQNHKI